MAAAVLIASGTTEDNSADFTVAAGTPTTISLFDADGVFGNDVAATLFKKSSGGVYRAVEGGNLTAMKPLLVIDGPGEFRVTKYASVVAFGVDQD
jgi:hypothetical protein